MTKARKGTKADPFAVGDKVRLKKIPDVKGEVVDIHNGRSSLLYQVRLETPPTFVWWTAYQCEADE